MLRPNQALGRLFDAKNNATCASGAIAEALGILDTSVVLGSYVDGRAVPAEWRPLLSADRACPACGDVMDTAMLIVHLNNWHWTREDIASWLETIEAQYDTPSQPQPVPVEVSQ